MDSFSVKKIVSIYPNVMLEKQYCTKAITRKRLKKIFMPVIALLCTQVSPFSASTAPAVTDDRTSTTYFIDFQAGNYKQPIASSINGLIGYLNTLPKSHQLKIIGLSKSKTAPETMNLALTRAKIVAKILHERSINQEVIEITSIFEYFKSAEHLEHGVKILITANNRLPTTKVINIGFVQFLAGNYEKENEGEITKLKQRLNRLPESSTLRIVGISHSRTSKANKLLALRRAKVVAKRLIDTGFDINRISIDTEVKNLIESNAVLHGAYIYAESIFNIHQKPILKDLCTEFVIKTGSLKSNIEREIGDCGYLLGEWGFGTETELIDWYIPIPFQTNSDNGVLGILTIIEENYQIRAHVHELDKSIDFLASPKYKEGQ